MAHPSPLKPVLAERAGSMVPYGPEGTAVELADAFVSLELEYAALRKRCVVIDRPDRGLIEVTGDDRIAFLNNMITQELKDLSPGDVTASFWLNRKGRVDADLRVITLNDRLLLEADAHAVVSSIESLGGYVFAESVEMSDITAGHHRLDLIGPTSIKLWNAAAGHDAPEPGKATQQDTPWGPTVVDRSDELGVPALAVTLRADAAAAAYNALVSIGSPEGLDRIGDENAAVADDGSPASQIRLRDAGWHARNIARIEAGQPQFMLDFGPTNLPAETGLLDERVSFTKGCYLGQEVVARMHALGHPKQTLVAIRCEQRVVAGGTNDYLQPATGSVVTPVGEPDTAVGAVTSATLSPALGSVPICFAQVKWGHHTPGTTLEVDAEGVRIQGIVQPTLRFT